MESTFVSIPSKTRSLARRGLKIQRRVAIAEALFWPVLLGIGVVIGTAVLLARRLRYRPTPSAAVGTSTPTPLSGPVDSTAGLEPVRH
jgi:hypothetical protein